MLRMTIFLPLLQMRFTSKMFFQVFSARKSGDAMYQICISRKDYFSDIVLNPFCNLVDINVENNINLSQNYQNRHYPEFVLVSLF